jgi:hypothetical protein
VLPANREGLARGTTGNEVNAFSPTAEIQASHIGADQIKVEPHTAKQILAKGPAAFTVVLNDCDGREPCPMQAERQATATGKQLD